MRLWSWACVAALLSVATQGVAESYHASFHPGSLKGPRRGGPNEVLVLGTPHLSSLPTTFQPDSLRSVLERLAAWKPQEIAIEALSGPQCAYLRQYPDRYRDTVEGYCFDPAHARAATGLDVPAATQSIGSLLATWPQPPTVAQRRHLAALFLAAGEPASALVQWLRLPVEDRRAGEGLDQSLVLDLERLRDRRDESVQIAAVLAARLGLERVRPMDDHTADAATLDDKAYGEAITRAWDNPASARRKAQSGRLEARIGSPGGVLAMYRAYNAPGQARRVFESDFGAALQEPSPQGFGRGYVGYWETRNLRMAANIRDVLAARPGMRLLVVVGASHKGYLEAYLDQMHDLRLVDAAAVLK